MGEILKEQNSGELITKWENIGLLNKMNWDLKNFGGLSKN